MRNPKNGLREILREARIKDLPKWYELYGYCCKCGHIGEIRHEVLLHRFGTDSCFIDLHRRLRCKSCRTRGEAQFGIAKMLR